MQNTYCFWKECELKPALRSQKLQIALRCDRQCIESCISSLRRSFYKINCGWFLVSDDGRGSLVVNSPMFRSQAGSKVHFLLSISIKC